MATSSARVSAALEPVVVAVRRVLRDLEPKEIPVSLRRVAAHAGRRLPPPLARSVLVELDRNEWLRGKTAEILDDEDGLGAAFLAAEPGWWLQLGDVVGEAAAAEASQVDAGAAIADLEGRLTEAKRRSTELRTEQDRLTGEIRGLRRELRERPAAPQTAPVDDHEEDRRHLQEAVDEERRGRLDAEARLAELRRRVAHRRERRREQAGTGPAARSGGFDDPVEVARRLDLEAAALAAGVRGQSPASPPAEATPLPAGESIIRVPAGVAPDSSDAIDWLLGLAEPATVLVDGYNVTFLIDAEHFATSELRRRLVVAVAGLRRRSGGHHRVMVVFDSVEIDEGSFDVGPGGVEVRFTAADLLADDEIVDLAAAMSGSVVVISNDRALRDRAEAVGAVTLWGTALVEWLERT